MSQATSKGLHGADPHENELTTNSLDLFSDTPSESFMLAGEDIQINANNSIESSPFVFDIQSSSNSHFIYLPASVLHMKLRVTKKDGSAIALTDDVSCSPLALSVLSQAECYVNDVLCSDLSSTSFAIKSFNEIAFSYGSAAKEAQMKGTMYSHERAEEADRLSTLGEEDDINQTLKARKVDYLVGSKPIHLVRPLNVDFMNGEKFLPPHIKVQLKFTKNNDHYCLIAPNTTTEYKITVENMYLVVRRVIVNHAFASLFAERRLKNLIRMPFCLSGIRTHLLTSGTQSKLIPNIADGIRNARQLFVTMYDSDAFNGMLNQNPFNSQPFDLESIEVQINGKPNKVVWENLDFSSETVKNGSLPGYLCLLRNLGVTWQDEDLGLKMSDYAKHRWAFAMDFSPDLCGFYRNHQSEASDSINLSLRFKKPLSKAVMVCVHITRDAEVVINESKKVTLLVEH